MRQIAVCSDLCRKIDELSYHQNHHNANCSIVIEEFEGLHRYIKGAFEPLCIVAALSTPSPDILKLINHAGAIADGHQ